MSTTIELRDLRKRYGRTVAVDGLSFTVAPGEVTAFVGPNGAGKSTTMRMILGLDAPDEGAALVGGQQYRSLPSPLRVVGALLDAGAVHPGRRARDHLLWMARAAGARWPAGGPAGSRWACASVSGWPAPSSATRRCWCSTSRSTGSTPRGSSGFAAFCVRWPPTVGPCWCPAT